MPRRWMLLLLACVACASEAAPPPPTEELTFEVLHVASDTTGDLVGHWRVASVAEQIAKSPVNVVCLQGIGGAADRANVKSALASVFPFSLDLPTDDASPIDDPADANGVAPPASAPPCQDAKPALAGAIGCFRGSNCMGEGETIDRVSCLAPAFCLADDRFAADPERRCRSCIVGHARTGSTLTEIGTRCRDLPHPLALRGGHGMMILSKVPLSRPGLYVLPSEGTRRAILSATLTTARGTTADVFCASLGPTEESALPSDPRVSEPYPGPYGTPLNGWVRENALQVEKLIAHVAAHREGRPAVVLGNFGASVQLDRNGAVVAPATGALAAARLEEAFTPALATTYAPSCTVCTENSLVHDSLPSFHNRIYLAGLEQAAVKESTRSYLGAVVPATARTMRVPLSMQFGFRSRVALPAPR